VARSTRWRRTSAAHPAPCGRWRTPSVSRIDRRSWWHPWSSCINGDRFSGRTAVEIRPVRCMGS
jgi:hypothetical protein